MNGVQRDQLRELVRTLDDLPDDIESIIGRHIDIEALADIAHRRMMIVIRQNLVDGAMSELTLHKLMTSAFMDAFAIGCGWATMKQGSGEK